MNSLSNRSDYWSNIASNLEWFEKWNTTLNGDFSSAKVKWFEGGKTNLAYNCLILTSN